MEWQGRKWAAVYNTHLCVILEHFPLDLGEAPLGLLPLLRCLFEVVDLRARSRIKLGTCIPRDLARPPASTRREAGDVLQQSFNIKVQWPWP